MIDAGERSPPESAIPISMCRERIVGWFRDHPAGGRPLAERRQIVNDDFAYFTHATLDFASSAKNDPPIEPQRYLDAVCAAVSRHLMLRRALPQLMRTSPGP